MSILHELIDLPAGVAKSSFVVKLAEGITRPAEIVETYAVTPDIAGNLDAALGYVEGALRKQQSEAAYVHGSFGSGKSHFMAMLSLLLANDPRAWADPDLHELRAKHEWVKEKRLLRLHFNMMGAGSSEERILAGYLTRVRADHSDAPLPALYQDDKLFDNAQSLRLSMGDDAFFAKLNAGGASTKKGWGKRAEAATWDPASFDAARSSPERDERDRLFSTLVRTLFPAFAESNSGFVGLEEGLRRMTRHAAGLGYHGVVLFLDELILWLATRANDKNWLSLEVSKLSRIAEVQGDIPLVSFIARQRDITELVGDQFAGPELQTLRDSLKYWEGRFNGIKLPDRNLPAVVQKRVVRPKDDAAKARLDQAFESMRRTAGPSWATLLAEIGDDKAFRQVYPFSPAVIEALIGLSHYLQRERTALKVLVELLLYHLDDFEMGRVVPIGDIFDVLAGGEEPMDGHMRERFASAKRLYNNELLPRIHAENKTGNKERCQRLRDNHPVSIGCSNCREMRCRADNRLVKTLLLAALVPELPLLRNLTASRLVQLNHGTLKSLIPGNEVSEAAGRLRSWSAEIGKLRVEGEGDPRVNVVLEGIDVTKILDAARNTYSQGAGRRLLRDILFEALRVKIGSEATVEHKVVWRGTTRTGVVAFGNVREMKDDAVLRCPEDAAFKLIIDYPFDEAGHGPDADEGRVREFCETQRSATIVWIPHFFGARVTNDLRDLVVIDRVLDDPLKMYLANLRPDDQRRAREELEHLRAQKRARVRRALDAAYGLKRPEAGDIDEARRVDTHIHVLMPGWQIRGVVESVLERAVERAVQELLNLRYPRHPHFTATTTPARLKASLVNLEKLCEADKQRLPITRQERGDWEILENLGIVDATDAAVTLRGAWVQDIERILRQDGLEVAPTVEQLTQKLDPSGQRGLLPEIADLEVLAYAAAGRRELLQDNGRPAGELTLGKVPGDLELVQARLPEERPWQDAVDRAGRLFGIAVGGRARTGKNLRLLFDKIVAARQGVDKEGAGLIAEKLGERGGFLPATAPRLATATRAAELLALLDTRDAVELTQKLGTFDPSPSSWPALQRHMQHAAKTLRVLGDDVYFNVFEGLRGSGSEGAAELLTEVGEALAADELNVDLAAKLPALVSEAQRRMHTVAPAAASATKAEAAVGVAGITGVAEGQGEGWAAWEAARPAIESALQEAGPDARFVFTWKVVKR
jgi:hypothetical protein